MRALKAGDEMGDDSSMGPEAPVPLPVPPARAAAAGAEKTVGCCSRKAAAT